MRMSKHGTAKPRFASASYLRHDQISACHEVAPDQGIYKLTKYQRRYWMQAHITIVYAVLATTSDQSVLHPLVGSLCTFVWRLVLPMTHHSPLSCVYHALGSDWTHLVLLHVCMIVACQWTMSGPH